MKFQTVFSLITLILLSMFSAPRALAQTVPSFPTCANPQGTVTASYSEGDHGIPGNTETNTGSDTVYTLGEETTMQCFCADNGDGTQTNWWHAASLTEEEIQVLKNAGWVVVPNGALWGLAEGEWLTFNSPYACPKSDGSGESGNTSGTVLAASTDTGNVLGLASTGNIVIIYALAGFGALSILIGFLLRRLSLPHESRTK